MEKQKGKSDWIKAIKASKKTIYCLRYVKKIIAEGKLNYIGLFDSINGSYLGIDQENIL